MTTIGDELYAKNMKVAQDATISGKVQVKGDSILARVANQEEKFATTGMPVAPGPIGWPKPGNEFLYQVPVKCDTGTGALSVSDKDKFILADNAWCLVCTQSDY